MINPDYHTTRRHPRSLADAFPWDRAHSIEHFPATTLHDLAWAAAIVVSILTPIALAIYYWS